MYKLIRICETCCKLDSACVTGSSPCSTHWVMRSRARLLVLAVMAGTSTSRLLRSSSRWQRPMGSRRHALQYHCIVLNTESVLTCCLLRCMPKCLKCTLAKVSFTWMHRCWWGRMPSWPPQQCQLSSGAANCMVSCLYLPIRAADHAKLVMLDATHPLAQALGSRLHMKQRHAEPNQFAATSMQYVNPIHPYSSVVEVKNLTANQGCMLSCQAQVSLGAITIAHRHCLCRHFRTSYCWYHRVMLFQVG